MSSGRSLMRASWLGRVRYRPTYELQRVLMEQRKTDDIPDTLLLLEHEHVYTLGRRADETHLVTSEGVIEADRAEVVETDRGGEATYHGPGQLVAYPIISIRELKLGPVAYVRLLEETIIQMLAEHGIRGHRVVGKTGVWVGGEPGSKPTDGANPAGRKIAAIGVRISGGVAMHGMALNVSTDLRLLLAHCAVRYARFRRNVDRSRNWQAGRSRDGCAVMGGVVRGYLVLRYRLDIVIIFDGYSIRAGASFRITNHEILDSEISCNNGRRFDADGRAGIDRVC